VWNWKLLNLEGISKKISIGISFSATHSRPSNKFSQNHPLSKHICIENLGEPRAHTEQDERPPQGEVLQELKNDYTA